MLSLGTLFGGAEVVTVAFAEEQGSQAYAGPLLALWALGSLMAGLVTGAVTLARGPDDRVRLGAAGMCRDGAAAVHRLGAADGRRAAARRLRDRADPDRDHVARRADRARRAGSPRGWRSCTPGSSPASRRAPPSPAS